MRITRYALPLVAALSLTACGINSVPTAEENAKAKWADVENQYQRRADLVPNLVATVQGAALAERTTLTQVIEARVERMPAAPALLFADTQLSYAELNAHATRFVKSELPPDCGLGVSTVSTCATGLSEHAGIPFVSLASVLEMVSQPQA